MVADPTQLPFITLFFGVVIFILFVFLQAFLGLKNPRDGGPATIEKKVASNKCQVQLACMERSEETETDSAILKKIADILSTLPNIET